MNPRHLHSRLLHSQRALGCPLPFEAWPPRPRSQVTSPTPLRTAAQRLLLVHRPSRKTSSCSAYSSSENATTTPVSSEADERHSIGGPAAPLLMQRREASAIPVRLCHSTREKFHARRPVATLSHKRKIEQGQETRTAQQEESDTNGQMKHAHHLVNRNGLNDNQMTKLSWDKRISGFTRVCAHSDCLEAEVSLSSVK